MPIPVGVYIIGAGALRILSKLAKPSPEKVKAKKESVTDSCENGSKQKCSNNKGDGGGKIAGSIKNVNPTKGKQNCVNCSIATDSTLAGRAASALPGKPTSIRTLEKKFGSKFGSATSKSGIEKSMLKSGNGSRGIVFGSRGNQTGHVFNVVNQKGVIRFLDGQTGKAANLNGFNSLHLLKTTR